MYDETNEDQDAALAGSLLLAHPHLEDSNFACSVVLMTTHEEGGSVGVVLNKNTGKCLGAFSDEFEKYGLTDVPVYEGGPVEPNHIIIAAWKLSPEEGQFQLYFGLDPAVAQSKMLGDPDLTVRAFKGYSGWSDGQLLGELEANTWVVTDVDGELLDKMEGRELWRNLIMEVNPELGMVSLEPEMPERN